MLSTSLTPFDPSDPVALAWAAARMSPLHGSEPGLPTDDLAALREVIGDARIVGLGEATHGTREHFRFKERIIRWLVEEEGFSVVAFEANMPEAERVNDFVRGGDGDVAALLGGMYFWTWNTEEVAELVTWMREYNIARERGDGLGGEPGGDALADDARAGEAVDGGEVGPPLSFVGFDMQSAGVSREIVRAYVRDHDPGWLGELDAAYEALGAAQRGGAFAYVFASLEGANVAGTTLSLHGAIRTENVVNGWAGLWISAHAPDGTVIANEQMRGSGPVGTQPWKEHEIGLDVPPEASSVTYGPLIAGSGGTAWFDRIELKRGGVPVRPAGPFDFEDDDEVAFTGRTPLPGFTDEVTDEEAFHGARSLRLRLPAQAQPSTLSKG